MLRLLLLTFIGLATLAPANAFDATASRRYASPDLYRPNVDQLTAWGPINCAIGRVCPAGGLSVAPDANAATGTLARSLGDLSGFKAPGPSGFARLDAAFFTANARTLFNSDASGGPANWLGNGAGGSAAQYAYGGFGQVVSLSGIGDVGVVGGTRTTDITTPGRLPIGIMGWSFNFKTTAPQTSWAGYMEARRKKGAGQVHGLEVNVTDLGDGSDRSIPSAMASGPNAVYSAWASGINIACGGNVTPGQQTGWDGSQNVTQAANCGTALPIYANGAKFEKGLIFGETALVGCDGRTPGLTCTMIEAGRGAGLAWNDSTTRQAARIYSDLSPTGAALRQTFTDFGTIFDAYGGATLVIASKPSDVNGVQIFGGGAAASPARIVAGGSPNASLGLSPSGGGVVQMQGVMQLLAYTVATLPVCDATRVGGMAYVTDAQTPTYRNGVVAGGTNVVPVFCSGSAWEAH
ncbi:hypothetical protein [Methylobacterium brachiatum]|uniref:hypothetical protein n=1 Tax=Methylobacterium brachiatum TaxID=269660 RepID=UPI000EFA3C8E|nr:hypothetical protein [Methylobacterium brachiatum]AYO85318.1 hypothetical protein EBB05_25905 [Methylobacterium brachiatum]